ncbi:DUF3307 domain-containing protein [Clostridium sp. HBUAS56017]|uniref:DUF3307 domain-containing protein n=1 Tax=Clostridium sp. HBUAS56017 TaxID=2571128 RepID=UPI001177EC20|nr:DUF3307 domain-containing protein [Clostridium sp. HBUAS56017]
MITALLITLISHLIGDFVLQTDTMAKGRDSCNYVGITRIKRSIFYNLIHGIIHGLILLILIVFVSYFTETYFYFPISLIALITFIHVMIDLLKPIIRGFPLKISSLANLVFKDLKLGSCNFNISKNKINFIIFLTDQLLHLIAIFIIFKLTLGIAPDSLYDFIVSLPSTTNIHDKILVIVLILFFSTFGAAYFSKSLLDSIKSDSDNIKNDMLPILSSKKLCSEEAKKGGFLIGILERLFIILGIVMSHPSVIAIVLTVKSIARYKKFDNDSFVEYYIIGTFFSFVIAILGGVVIAKIL